MTKKHCKTCGKELSKKNKSGYCIKHYDRTGLNNPFYGKTHSKETKEKLKEKCKEATKKMWEDPAYRDKVIKGVSKPRPESFKKEQSERIKQWYKDNPEQKTIRSESMQNSWKEGKITPNKYVGANRSKLEKKFIEEFKEIYPDIAVEQTLHLGDTYFFPDILAEDLHLIIEFYGNYWHGNPEIYKGDDIVAKDCKAKDVWERDEKRRKTLEVAGYHVEVVWEKNYKEDPESVFKALDQIFNWEILDI